MTFRGRYTDFALTLTCFSQAILGLIPTLVLIPLAQKSYTSTKLGLCGRASLSITAIHFNKTLLVTILAFLPIIKIIAEIKREERFSLSIVSMFYVITSMDWIVNLFLLRKEFRTIGYTSLYLRLFWLIDLVCNTMLVLSSLKSSFKLGNDEVIDIFYLFCLAFLNVYGWVHIKDLPYVPDPDETVDDYFRLIDLEKNQSRKSDLWENFIHTKESCDIEKQHAEIHIDLDKAPQLEYYKKSSNLRGVFDISVVTWEMVYRNDKLTTVHFFRELVLNINQLYVVTYQVDGDRRSTKRSYSEFYRLFRKTIEKFPLQVLPAFPEKKKASESYVTDVILERKEVFDKFLKLLCQKKLYTKHFFDFLKSPKELPYFGYLAPKELLSEESSSKISVANFNSNVITLDEKIRCSSFINMNEWDGVQFKYEYLQAQSELSNYLAEKISYKIDIVTATYRDNNIHYGITLSYKKSFMSFERTYTEFEELHQKMQNYATKQIPEFPTRGRLGILNLKYEEGLLKYSKNVLKEYLKSIALEQNLQNCPAFREFFKIDDCL